MLNTADSFRKLPFVDGDIDYCIAHLPRRARGGVAPRHEDQSPSRSPFATIGQHDPLYPNIPLQMRFGGRGLVKRGNMPFRIIKVTALYYSGFVFF